MSRQRAALATFVLLLVILAFARAHLASSTGIRMVGDAADYEAIASTMTLEGRAPFVYRPLVPLTVGLLFPGRLTLGFGIVCALAMFAALFTAGALARDSAAGYFLAAILFLNYQVLFSAANPARLDIVVLAVQLAFVWLALERNDRLFFILLPLCALLKESMLLGLAALALAAFPRRRPFLMRLGVAAVVFVALHGAIRWLAAPTAAMPPYGGGGFATAAAMLEMLESNVSALTPLEFFVAWGGLSAVVLYLTLGAGAAKSDPLLAATVVLLLFFPMPLATDLHRAWFELLAPLVMFLVLSHVNADDRESVLPALGLAMVASVIPYATRLIASEHLYLLILQNRLSLTASVMIALGIAFAGGALATWPRLRTRPSAAMPTNG